MSDQLDNRIRDLYAELVEATPPVPPPPLPETVDQPKASPRFARPPLVAAGAAVLTLIVVASLPGLLRVFGVSEDAADTTIAAAETSEALPEETSEQNDPFTPPDPLPSSGAPSGSGCTPGNTFTDLVVPDGIWFGYVVGRGADHIEFDLACLYFGGAARERAAEAGGEAPGDIWIVNENTLIRTVAVRADVPVHAIDVNAAGLVVVAFDEWPQSAPGQLCSGPSCAVWLHVTDGVLTKIVEQHLP